MKMTQCQIGKIGFIEDDIMMVDIDSGSEIGIEHIFEFQNAAARLVKTQKKIYAIVSYGAFASPTKAARELCGKEEVNNNHLLGRALVVHDMGQMILVKHTMKQRKSSIPTRIFTDTNNAKKWVQDLRAKNDEYQLLSEYKKKLDLN